MSKFSLKCCLMVAALSLLGGTGGCGWHLRGTGGDASFAQRIYLDGPGASTGFAGVFGTVLNTVGGTLVSNPAQSTGIVRLYRATFQRQPITISRTGRATGFDLSYRIIYDVRNAKGEILQGRKEFEVKRDYYNDQTLPLAQQSEEGQINEALANEAAQSLLRRVVNQLKQSEPPPTQPSPLGKPKEAS